MRSRSKVVNLARSWVGLNEKDGSYKKIIDIYNSQKSFPRGIKMDYKWSWCACTWSALAISLGYTDIMPIEISCGELIKKAKSIGIWKENDGFVPSPGDGILYDWDDNGIGDNTGWPDHIGIIEYVNINSGYMVVIEGNYSDSVKKRTISINGKYIRGFITPKYTDNTVNDDILELGKPAASKKSIDEVAKEVIVGKWGSGTERKKALDKAGYSYSEVQDRVNDILNGDVDNPKVNTSTDDVIASCKAKSGDPSLSGSYITTANLYCRNDAGSNKKALCKIPKGTKVQNYGFYTSFNGVKWLLIQFNLNRVRYTGFSSSQYLKKQ